MLLKFEFSKHMTWFNILLTVIMLLFNIGITAYQHIDSYSSDTQASKAARADLVQLYEESPEDYEMLYADYLDRLDDYEAQQYQSMFGDDIKNFIQFENKVIDLPNYGDRSLFSDVETILNRTDDHNTKIHSLLKDTSQRILDTDNKNTYLYRYYSELLLTYDKFSQLELPVEDVHGWNEFFSLSTPIIFLTVTSLALFSGVFTLERRVGICNIQRVSKKGGKELTGAKIVYIILSSTVVTALFTLSPLLIFATSTGLSDAGAPIQILDKFAYCPYQISILGYLAIYVLTRVLIFIAFSLAVAALGRYFNAEYPSFVFTALVGALGYIVATIPTSSRLYFLNKFSVVSIANVNILFERYRGLNIFGYCLDYTTTVLLIISLFTAFICILLFLSAKSIAVNTANSFSTKRSVRYTTSLLGTEFYKQCIGNAALLMLIGALLIKCIISASYYTPKNTSTQQAYRDYISQVAGEVTDEKVEAIEAEKEYIDKTLSQYSSMHSAYRSGKISSDDYKKYLGKYNYAEYYEYACELLNERKDYLLSIRDIYPNVEFVYEEGVEKYIFSPLDLPLVLTVVFIGSSMFPVEYQSGFSKIMRLCKNGRNKIFACKVLFTLIFGGVMCVLFGAVDILFLTYNYRLNFLSANIMSVPSLSDIGISMSIGNYMLIHFLIHMFGCILMFLMVTLLSCIMKSHLYTAILSAAVILIPYILEEYGVNMLNLINITRITNPFNFTADLPIYLIYLCAATVIYCIACRSWNGRRRLK